MSLGGTLSTSVVTECSGRSTSGKNKIEEGPCCHEDERFECTDDK